MLRAAGNCTCSGHGTASNASVGGLSACSCACDSGWGTAAQQDLFSPVFCNVPQSTLNAMGNPAVAAGATPAGLASPSSSGLRLTTSGWALVVGVLVGFVCICCCCYRRAPPRRCPRCEC